MTLKQRKDFIYEGPNDVRKPIKGFKTFSTKTVKTFKNVTTKPLLLNTSTNTMVKETTGRGQKSKVLSQEYPSQ